MKPRKPTQREKQALVAYLNANGYSNLEKEVESWLLAVFEDGKTVHPNYQGKVLLVATTTTHNVGLDRAEIYIYPDGKITRVTEMGIPGDWLTHEVYKGDGSDQADGS